MIHPGGGTRIRSSFQGSIWITAWLESCISLSLLLELGLVLIRVPYFALSIRVSPESVSWFRVCNWRRWDLPVTWSRGASFKFSGVPCHATSSCHVTTKHEQYGCHCEADLMTKPSGAFTSIRTHHMRREGAWKEMNFKSFFSFYFCFTICNLGFVYLKALWPPLVKKIVDDEWIASFLWK